MSEVRRQLTLFIDGSNDAIEKIRAEYNPKQYELIPAHVTLCREDEIEPIEDIIKRIESIDLKKPIRIEFKPVERFANGKGVQLPATNEYMEFRELRKSILGQINLVKEQFPHITLMHPRNSTCSDELFEKIKSQEFPTKLEFRKISLIEQKNWGKWNVLQEFNIVK